MADSAPAFKTDSYGTRRWYFNGKLHRTDGPAIEYANGSKAWYIKGKSHRIDGPAVEWADGTKAWYLNGKQHRTDGPAVEDADGTKIWYLNGQRHRTDGAALERTDGYKVWYSNGEVHRTDGPAIEYADETTEWWANGQEISTPYTYMLNAAFSRGLTIPSEVCPDMLKSMAETRDPQNDEARQLNTILHKHWPADVKNILVTLFKGPDLTIKHLAFSLLGYDTMPEKAQGSVRL